MLGAFRHRDFRLFWAMAVPSAEPSPQYRIRSMVPRPPGEETPAETDRHRTLLEINNALISNLTREALFHAIGQAVRGVVPFERTAIFLRDAEKDVLVSPTQEGSFNGARRDPGLDATERSARHDGGGGENA